MTVRQNDGRKLNRDAQAQIRITAVQRVLNGESPEEVVKSIGYTRRIIYRWLADYRSGGYEALKVHKSTGRPSLLDGKQMEKLYHMIVDKTPEQYKFPFVLWTIEIIREVIKRIFNVSIGERSRYWDYQRNVQSM